MAKKSAVKSTKKAQPLARPARPRAPRSAAPPPANSTEPAGEAAVTIRMYRQGLGDCFLLRFPQASAKKPVYVLIDCGVLQKTPREPEKLRSVVEDIKATTGGRVDLLIVTHEHWDHVAGFSHVHDVFATGQITFDRVWLSWLENLNDPLAKTVFNDLAKKKKRVAQALGLVEKLGLEAKFQAAAADDPISRRMDDDVRTTRSILGFLGMADEKGLAAAGRMSLGDTMNWVRSLVKPGDYCEPGECRPLPGDAGVKVYVLGPPRDENLIKMMDAKGEAEYAFQADRVSLLAAIDQRAPIADGKTPKAGVPAPGPFEVRNRISREQALSMPFFRARYGFPEDPLGDESEAWRRIDDDWLVSGMSELALQIDQRVNNSSLAVAFELPDGRTLIFPGDAQFGNWLSWDNLTFRDQAGNALPITTKQLLNRAVFYKVGHHGSHNATRPASLHQMTSGDLVAMIPTDEQFALLQYKKGSWRMPAEQVFADLKKFTSGRILRADKTAEDLESDANRSDASPGLHEFRARVTFAPTEPLLPGLDPKQDPLFVEYRIPLK